MGSRVSIPFNSYETRTWRVVQTGPIRSSLTPSTDNSNGGERRKKRRRLGDISAIAEDRQTLLLVLMVVSPLRNVSPISVFSPAVPHHCCFQAFTGRLEKKEARNNFPFPFSKNSKQRFRAASRLLPPPASRGRSREPRSTFRPDRTSTYCELLPAHPRCRLRSPSG
jgi:hypothetical protein